MVSSGNPVIAASSIAIGSVLKPKTKVDYEYDFVSTTQLNVRSLGETRAPGDDVDLNVMTFTAADTLTKLQFPGPQSRERPTWSPDGTRIAFVCRWATGTDLCIVNRDGTGLLRLTDDTQRDDSPAWSPDGARIAFARYPAGSTSDVSAEIVLMDVATKQITPLTLGLDPSWSPDGSRLVFAGGDGLFVIGASGGNRTRLTAGAHRAPAWRP